MSPKSQPQLPIDIYIRVSSVGDREGASFLSPEMQEAECRKLLAYKGLTAGRVFTDLDETGRKMARPAFDAVMERALSGESGGIVVWKLSRFGRSTAGVIEAAKALETAGATLLSSAEEFDTSSAMGEFIFRLFASLAELESEQIRENWSLVLDSNAKRGVYHGRAPAGYSKSESGTLVPNDWAPVVREAFRLKIEDAASWGTIARYLTESGLPTQSGKPWSATATRNLIGNRAYIGELRIGERVRPDAHEALVDDETFRRANRKGRRDSGQRTDGPLLGSGIVRCGVCGSAMTVGQTKQPNGKVYRFLRCSAAQTKGHPTIQLNIIEPYLAAKTLQTVERINLAPEAEVTADPELVDRLEDARVELQELERELAEGAISATIYAKAASKVESDIVALQAEIASPTAVPAVSKRTRERQAAIDYLTAVAEGRTDDLDPSAKVKARQLIAEMLGRIEVAAGRGTAEERLRLVTTDEETIGIKLVEPVPDALRDLL